MLVVEYRNDTMVLLKRIRDQFQEPSSRVQLLLFAVPGIVSMFPDAEDSIDRNVVAANGDGLLDRVEKRHVKLRGQPRARSRSVNCSTYIDASRNAGPGPPSCLQPSRILPTSTSAWSPR